MHTSDDFLRALEAEPGDRTRRLVFADWLDERADPRGELIRVEEEMRTLPVFSDRFWELKPRRNELRAAAGSEWCGRMRYGTECEPVFRHGIPDGWRERWRLIREFTERWHRVPLPDVGGRQKEIAEAEARLGRTLPPSVREWIAFSRDARSLPINHGLLDRGELGCVPREDAFPLWLGADRFVPIAYAAVGYDDLDAADPPIRGYRMDITEESDAITLLDGVARTTASGFSIDHLVVSLAGEWGGFVLSTDRGEEVRQRFRDAFPSRAVLGDIEYFEMDNLIARITPLWPEYQQPSPLLAGSRLPPLRYQGERITLVVQAAQGVSPSRIPAVVRDHQRWGLLFHGNLGPPNGIPF